MKVDKLKIDYFFMISSKWASLSGRGLVETWKCELTMDGWRVNKGGDAADVAQIELKAHF